MRATLLILSVSYLFSQSEYCSTQNHFNSRSIYNVGDTLSIEDQNMLFPVCNGSGNYSTGDSWSLADYDGSQNGGQYHILFIDMSATW